MNVGGYKLERLGYRKYALIDPSTGRIVADIEHCTDDTYRIGMQRYMTLEQAAAAAVAPRKSLA